MVYWRGAQPPISVPWPQFWLIKVQNSMMLRILADKDTHFSVVPSGIARWATFMKSIGLIRQDVTDWKQFFYPESHALAGS